MSELCERSIKQNMTSPEEQYQEYKAQSIEFLLRIANKINDDEYVIKEFGIDMNPVQQAMGQMAIFIPSNKKTIRIEIEEK